MEAEVGVSAPSLLLQGTLLHTNIIEGRNTICRTVRVDDEAAFTFMEGRTDSRILRRMGQEQAQAVTSVITTANENGETYMLRYCHPTLDKAERNVDLEMTLVPNTQAMIIPQRMPIRMCNHRHSLYF